MHQKIYLFFSLEYFEKGHFFYLVQYITLLPIKNVLSLFFSSVLPPEVVHNNPELCRCSPKDLFQVSGTELPARTWPRSLTPEGSRRDPIPDSGCRRNR
jgi:hypothetical protein